MRKVCLVLLAIFIQANDIRISEVMSNPQGSEYENEFIEIFNASNHVIQINGWVLSDGNGEDTISYHSGPPQIQPGKYALILDPGYNHDTGPYLQFLQDSLPIYTISTDGSFGSGGLANGAESVIIRAPDTSQISQMSWVTATQNGHSWELVSISTADSQSIWEESLTFNGTPGLRNSVTRPLYNLSFSNVGLNLAEMNEPVSVTIWLQNLGELPISGFSLYVFLDSDQNGTRESGEWEYTQVFEHVLGSQDSLEVSIDLFRLTPGVHRVEFQIVFDDDEVLTDNNQQLDIVGAYPLNAISITEVMYSPAPDQQGEWVELQNISETTVSLQGWTLLDANQTRHLITDSLLQLEPLEYLTLCASIDMGSYFGLESHEVHELRSWPSLNSSSDSVRLFDASGHGVAKMHYRGSWGEPGISLERRHPSSHPLDAINWHPSTNLDGGTPSRINTRHLLPVEIQIESISAMDTGITGPAQVRIRIDFQNLGTDTLYLLEIDSDADIYWSGALASFEQDSIIFSGPILWPGYNNIPIKILHEAEVLIDTSIQVLLGYPPGLVAINEIHYDPNVDQCEFLELINLSSSAINLRGWSFADRSGARGDVVDDLFVQPDSMVLWTVDATKLRDWTPTGGQISELSNWPSLNNGSDSIIIKDPVGKRMLAHAYENPPAGTTGRSLERLALWKPSYLHTSWLICKDPWGITPGRENSQHIPLRNLGLHELSVHDPIIWASETFASEILIINHGFELASDVQLNLALIQDEFEIDFYSITFDLIQAGDTLRHAANLFASSPGRSTIRAELIVEGDGYLDDNLILQDFYISGEPSHLILNEIMPLPIVDQNEWLEIYNRSDAAVDLKGWMISDNSNAICTLSDTSLILMSHSYLVVGGENDPGFWSREIPYHSLSQFPTLNNSDDQITLFDPQNMPMDHVSYGPENQPVSGRSLERIRSWSVDDDFDNWDICIAHEGSTPGERNSLDLDVLISDLNIQLEPNPFSPDGDGHGDQLTISYELPFESGVMSVMVFDMAGRVIAEPVQIKPVSHRGQVMWDGEAKYGGKAVTGLYIMKLLIDDQAGKVWSSFKKVYLMR